MRHAADRAAQVIPRLPREVERDPRHAAIVEALAATARPLWPNGMLAAPVLPLAAALRAALGAPAVRGALVRGLEGAEAMLAAEARGLAASPAEPPPVPRVSRLILVSNDGAERFYRQVERLAAAHAPRVLVCVLDVPSGELGALLFGAGRTAKLVTTSHKEATARLLLAIAPPAVP